MPTPDGLQIIQYNNSILRENARVLSKDEVLSKEIQELIHTMREVMRTAPGVGLAAPQIGIPIQIAVIEDAEKNMYEILPEIRKERGREHINFHVIINPKITTINNKLNYFFEGCLSVKGYARVTPRYESVRVDCLDENGNNKTITATGWYARILQHEIDHLHGKLYIDIANPKTEIIMDEINKHKWLNATRDEIQDYYNKTCGEKCHGASDH